MTNGILEVTLTLSVILQFVAGCLALSLIRVTGRRRAWIAFAVAIFLMALRRGISLYRLLGDERDFGPDPLAEAVALAISILLLVGLLWIRSIFRDFQTSEKRLAERERYHSSILNSLREEILVIDRNGIVTDVNETFLSNQECSREEVIGKRCIEVEGIYHLHCGEHGEECFLKEVFETGEPRNNLYTHANPDGSYSYVDVLLLPLRKPDGSISHVVEARRDVTDLYHTRGALEDSEEKYRKILENMEEGYYETNIRGDFTFFNQSLARILGYPPEELIGMNNREYTTPEEAERMFRIFNRVYTTGTPASVSDYEIIRKDGERRYLELSSSLLKDSNGVPIGFYGVARDITDRRRSDEERRRLSQAIEQVAEGVMITDHEGTIQYVNPAFEQTTGYTWEEAIGQNPRIFKSGKHDEAFYRDLWETLNQGERWRGRFVNKRKDGTFYTVDSTISPVFDSSGAISNFIAVKRDITENLRLQEQLHHAQKMESIGRLAGGIAHDFNNILQGMFGFIEFASKGLSPDDERFEDLEEIRKGAERAASLTRQLLAFSRQQMLDPRHIDLNQTIDQVLKMIRRLIGEDIELKFVSGHRLGKIHADPGKIEQIIVNLCVNARDAMPNGGKLTIETRELFFDSEFVKSNPWAQPGRYVLLSIADTGCGMSEEVLSKAFEPFFTTKELDKGTGLGLSTVYGIVKQHEGLIHVISEVGKGTVFEVYFPTVEEEESEGNEEKEDLPPGGTETILVAEDDPAVRKVTVSVLEDAGYTVLSAEDGHEALELFESNIDRLSLAILDVVMPKMGGQEVHSKIKEWRPSIPVIFSSGYSDVHERLVADPEVELIQKPVSPKVFLRKVRETLDRHRENR